MSTSAPWEDPTLRRRAVLGTCLVSSAMTHLDATMVAVALPFIRVSLGASDRELHWVVTSYLLGFGLVLLLAGRLGDVLGRRTAYVVGTAVVLAGATGAAFAPSVEVLLVARTLHGLGAGLLLPQGGALIQNMFSPLTRGKAYAALGVSISAATTIGPVFAGVLLHLTGGGETWRLLFVVGMPVSIGVIVGAWRLFPGPLDHRADRPRWSRFDLVGALIAGVAVVTLLYPLLGEAQVPLSQRPWLVTPAGLVCGAVLFWHVRRRSRAGRESIVDPSLRRVPAYTYGASVSALFFSGFTGVTVILSLLLQEGMGLSPLLTAVALAPWAVGNAIGAPIGGRLVVHAGRRLVVGGATLTTVVLASLAWLVASVPPPRLVPWLVALMLLGGIGSGLTIGPNLTVTMSRVDPVRAGSASALMQTGQRLGSAAGMALTGSILFAGAQQSYAGAGGRALAAAAVLVAAAAAVALADVIRSHRSAAHA